jgi:hypothetical protein
VIFLFFYLGLLKVFTELLLTSKILFLIGLLFLIVQDFKERKVTLLLFPILLIIGAFLHLKTQFVEVLLLNLIINLGLVLVVLSMLLLYVMFIMKKKFNEVIGLGDLLFFVVLAVSFPTVSFVLLFCSSLLFSLIIYLIFKSKIGKHIPLAGLQGLFLFLLLFSNLIFNFVNLYAV